MKTKLLFALCFVMLAAIGYEAAGQQQRRRLTNHESLPPLMRALDQDKNGLLTIDEINNATKVLKKLDKNGDGYLMVNEVTTAPPKSNQRLSRYMLKKDTNGDGKLSREELGEGFKDMFQYDKDKDGLLSQKEILYAVDKFSSKPVGKPSGDGPGDN